MPSHGSRAPAADADQDVGSAAGHELRVEAAHFRGGVAALRSLETLEVDHHEVADAFETAGCRGLSGCGRAGPRGLSLPARWLRTRGPWRQAIVHHVVVERIGR